MMIPIRDKNTDIASEVARGVRVGEQIQRFAKEIAEKHAHDDTLNEGIANVARAENYNRTKIQRLIEETNTLAFNVLYDGMRKSNDRRVVFEVAEMKKILEYMGDDKPEPEPNPNFNYQDFTSSQTDLAKTASFRTNDTFERTASAVGQYQYNAVEAAEKTAQLRRSIMEVNSGVEKMAMTLLNNDVVNHNGNEIFNTVVAQVGLDEDATNRIMDTFEKFATAAKNGGRIPPDFNVNLELDGIHKRAANVMGGYSLLKTASEDANQPFEAPIVHPLGEINDYQNIIDLAKKIQNGQKQINKITGGSME